MPIFRSLFLQFCSFHSFEFVSNFDFPGAASIPPCGLVLVAPGLDFEFRISGSAGLSPFPRVQQLRVKNSTFKISNSH